MRNVRGGGRLDRLVVHGDGVALALRHRQPVSVARLAQAPSRPATCSGTSTWAFLRSSGWAISSTRLQLVHRHSACPAPSAAGLRLPLAAASVGGAVVPCGCLELRQHRVASEDAPEVLALQRLRAGLLLLLLASLLLAGVLHGQRHQVADHLDAARPGSSSSSFCSTCVLCPTFCCVFPPFSELATGSSGVSSSPSSCAYSAAGRSK